MYFFKVEEYTHLQFISRKYVDTMTDHITKRPTSAPQSKLELLVDESGNIPAHLLANRGPSYLPIVSSGAKPAKADRGGQGSANSR